MPKLDLIGIIVQDMPKALAFYRALGLPIAPEMDSEGHVECVLPNGLRVAWDSVEVIKSFSADYQAPSGHPRIGMAFLCENAAEVNAQYQRIISMGYASHHEPFDAFWGQRYAQVQDPDGNIVDLFAPL
jgi:uncharacterized glyoxalase superfamily protein PhnB